MTSYYSHCYRKPFWYLCLCENMSALIQKEDLPITIRALGTHYSLIKIGPQVFPHMMYLFFFPSKV